MSLASRSSLPKFNFKTHMPLTQWFLTFYFDKRDISAVQLEVMVGTTYKTVGSMPKRIRTEYEAWDETHQLYSVIKFDDKYFGSPTADKKRN